MLLFPRIYVQRSKINNMVSCSGRWSFSTICIAAVLLPLISVTIVDAELKQVNVIFRHGDRTPDDTADEKYPNDPYLNDDFYPMGRGQLTNKGKRREYALGRFLRERYGTFLGDVYIPQQVKALSSDYDRTKMSLQLVLAGLYPPNKLQQWNRNLNWQPIPADYLRRYEDNVFLPEDCLLFTVEYDRVLLSPEGQQGIAKYSDLMKQLTKWTGKNISTPNDLYYLYHTLTAEQSLGLTLPEWTHKVFPHGELWDGTIFSYNISNSTPLLKRLYGGPLLRIFTKNMLDIVTGAEANEVKLHLYSGHESNVAAVMFALHTYYPHVPEYSSAIVMELHDIDDAYYVKVLNYLGIPSKMIELQMPGCNKLCPLDQYLQLIEDVMPSTDELVCDKGLTAEFADKKSLEELELLKNNLIRTSATISSK